MFYYLFFPRNEVNDQGIRLINSMEVHASLCNIFVHFEILDKPM